MTLAAKTFDLDGIGARARRLRPLPLCVLVAFAALAASGTFLVSLGGRNWGLATLLAVLGAVVLSVWLSVYRRFVDLVTFLLAFSVPIFLDVQLWQPETWSIVTGWPAGLTLGLADIFLYILGITWFVELTLGRAPQTVRLGWTSRGMELFLAAGLLFPVHSLDWKSSLVTWTEVLRYAAVFVYVAKRVQSASLLRWIVYGIAAHVWLQGLISIVQYTTGHSLGLEILGERAGLKILRTDDGADLRAGGLMGHPNDLALFLTLVGPLVLAMTLRARRILPAIGWGSTYVVLNVALLFTFSRAGWLCALASFFWVFHRMMARRGYPRRISIGVPVTISVVVLLAVFVGFESFRERLLDDDRGSSESRIDQWKTAFHVIAHWPWAGTGIGSYAGGAFRYAVSQGTAREVFMRVHNGSLMVTAEMGIFAAIGYHCWYYGVLRRGYKIWNARDELLATIGLGLFTGLCCWFVKSMYNIHTPVVDPPLWLFCGLLVAVAQLVARSEARAVAKDAADAHATAKRVARISTTTTPNR
ncbi:MAG: O-antigen ligase family protein [Planctomycetota bacterium]